MNIIHDTATGAYIGCAFLALGTVSLLAGAWLLRLRQDPSLNVDPDAQYQAAQDRLAAAAALIPDSADFFTTIDRMATRTTGHDEVQLTCHEEDTFAAITSGPNMRRKARR